MKLNIFFAAFYLFGGGKYLLRISNFLCFASEWNRGVDAVTIILDLVEPSLREQFLRFTCSKTPLVADINIIILSAGNENLPAQCHNKIVFIESFNEFLMDQKNVSFVRINDYLFPCWQGISNMDASNVRICLFQHNEDVYQYATVLDIFLGSSHILISNFDVNPFVKKTILLLDKVVPFLSHIRTIPIDPAEWPQFLKLVSHQTQDHNYTEYFSCDLTGSCDFKIPSILGTEQDRFLLATSERTRHQWLDGQLPDDLSLFDEFRKPEDDLVLDTIRVHTHTFVSDSSAGASGKIQ